MSNDFGLDGDNLVAPIGHRSCELVAYINAKAASTLERTPAFTPNVIQSANIATVRLVESDLLVASIIFELPVRRRGYDEVYGVAFHSVQ